MKPIFVSVAVDRPREEASAFLDELAAHVVDWSFAGAAAGVGGTVRMRANVPGQQWMDTRVLESLQPPCGRQ